MIEKTNNLAEFQAEAARFAQGLAPASNRATVVGLYGDLGAGKTTFVQAAAKALGVDTRVSSPTFLIFKSYPLPLSKGENERGWDTLIHVDAYRLKHSDELRKLRFEELLTDPKNLIFVEWADKVTDLLPSDHVKIRLQFVDDSIREMKVE